MPWTVKRIESDPPGFYRVIDVTGQAIAGVRGLDHAKVIVATPAMLEGLRKIEAMALNGMEGFRRQDVAEVARNLYRLAIS